MKVTSKVYVGKVKEIDMKAMQSLLETADALKSDLIQSQTMPFDTGAMQNRSTFIDDSNKSKGEIRIVTDTPYARRMYYHPEYNFKKDKNKNAGGLWFEPYVSGAKKDFVKNTFAKLMKGKMR
jgi:hypothetical protein